ncbi:MAG: energy transducer TonB [Opitutaceae bacterium]|nr:energy transducer TonB [Opitutaceae bacterium]
MKTDLFISIGIAAMTHAVAIFAFNDKNPSIAYEPDYGIGLICDLSRFPQIEELEPEILPDEVVDYSEANTGAHDSELKSNIESGSFERIAGGPILSIDESRSAIKVPLCVGTINVTAGVETGTWAPAGLSGIESLDSTPRAISQIAPRYPHDMRRSGIDGRVMVRMVVGPDGRVRSAEALKFSHRPFADAATKAVKKWKFEPGKRQGRRVAFRLTVPVLFTVSDN